MKEISRTIAFVVVAAVSVLGAAGMHWASRPKASAEFADVSKPFYPDFKNPLEAKGLKVAAFDEDTASIKEFEVVFKDGKWRIPSHHDYPADGADRLAKTAASVMEITKDALASPRTSDHARFGVLDPLDEESTALKGRGQRITITGENGAVLADYIIGKKVDKRDGYYYVRNPKENQTYLARVEISLSTKFADWIESDLLKLDADKLVEVDVEKYSIDRTAMRIVNPERSKLTRTSFSDPWKLEGLNEETEELKADEVRSLVSNLDDLKIVGIRSKPAGLRPDLKIDSKIARNPIARTQLMNSLVDKGFLPVEDQDGNPRLVSTEGEVIASTSEGVEYVLHFGEVFTGSDMEIESGFAKEDDSKKKGGEQKSDDQAGDAKKADGEKTEGAKDEADADSTDKKKEGLKKSRYLMVLVQFDESRLGPEPVKPEKPEPGEPAEAKSDAPKEGAEEKKPDEKKADEKKPDEKKSEEGASSGDEDEQDDAASDAKKDEAKAEKKPGAAKEDEKAATDKPADPKQAEKKDPAFEARMANYQRDLEKYENDVKLRDEKIAEGRKKVDQLNKRFGDWYYVISAESFDSLRLSRAALVKPKAKPEEAKPEDGKPGEAKPDEKKPEPKEEGAAAAETPAKPDPMKDQTKSEEKKAGEKAKEE